MKPSFERIDLESVDWNQLDGFWDRTVFQTPEWLSFIARTQNAEPVVAALKSGTATLGYFTGLIVRKFGVKVLGSPFPGWTTSYMGFNLLPKIPRSTAMSALTSFAFGELGCAHLEVMDRQATVETCAPPAWSHRFLTGFEINLTQAEEALWSNLSSACRRCIRKGQKNGVVVEEAQDLDFAVEYYRHLEDVFAQQSLVPSYGLDRVQELIKALLPTGRLLLLRARDCDGNCIATGIFPAMNQTMYFWGGASYRKSQILRPNEAIQWYALRYWKDRGIKLYDMGGGGRYKSKYGSSPISVPWFSQSKYPVIAHARNIAKSLVYPRQRLLGLLARRS